MTVQAEAQEQIKGVVVVRIHEEQAKADKTVKYQS